MPARFHSSSLSLSAGSSQGTELVYRWPSGATFAYSAQTEGGTIVAGRDVFKRRLRRSWRSVDSWTAGSLLPAVLNAGVAARAVAEVDGVNAMANGRGAPLGQLADRSQVVCRTTASLGLGLTARDAPNVCWRAQGSYTFDLAQAQLVPDGRGGRSLCLAEPRSLPALQLSLEVEHREAGNTTAGGVRITQRHHVFKPRIPALGLGLDIPVQIDTLELYGRCKMREGGEVELALDPWSGALSLRGNLAI